MKEKIWSHSEHCDTPVSIFSRLLFPCLAYTAWLLFLRYDSNILQMVGLRRPYISYSVFAINNVLNELGNYDKSIHKTVFIHEPKLTSQKDYFGQIA